MASRSRAGRQGDLMRAPPPASSSVPRPAPALTCLNALRPLQDFGQAVLVGSQPWPESSHGAGGVLIGEPGVNLSEGESSRSRAHDPARLWTLRAL